MVVGRELVFPSLTRHHSGVYVCRGDNGFSRDGSTSELTLAVEHSPEVEQTQMFVHSISEDVITLTCVVHAQPKANVTWTKYVLSVYI